MPSPWTAYSQGFPHPSLTLAHQIRDLHPLDSLQHAVAAAHIAHDTLPRQAPAVLAALDRALGQPGLDVRTRLFLLRLAVAAVLGVRGAQQLMDIPATTDMVAATALPYPDILAWAVAVASVLVAVALVLGLAVRFAGFGAALIAIGALVFVYWWRSPFQEGMVGFTGETELLLAILGVFLLLVGGGAWGIDGAIRKGRLQRKADKFRAQQV